MRNTEDEDKGLVSDMDGKRKLVKGFTECSNIARRKEERNVLSNGILGR